MSAAAPAVSDNQTANRTGRIVVIGGGLAGMAAAVALESAGFSVTLLEARQSLGGRASSFTEPTTGEQLDNCQHVLLGCCTNLKDFYHRLGVSHLIQYERTIYFRDARGNRHDLYGLQHLPAPFHLAPSLLMFEALTWSERIALSRAMMTMLRMGRVGRMTLGDTSFGDWLDDQRQPQSLIDKFYDPVVVSGLNELTRKSSAAYAIQIFQDAMLAHAQGYTMGLPTCPLSELYSKLPCKDVRLGARVSELLFDGKTIKAVQLTSGEIIHADQFILATNYHATLRWIPPSLAKQDSRFTNLGELFSVPILGAHLWFDRPVMTESHAALISGPLQWLFRKDATGTSLHGVISAARDWVVIPKEEALEVFEKQVRETLPAAKDAKLLRGVIVIEKRATFSPTPGIDRFRPMQAPPENGIDNLFLAGDYTKTGWPATMEGAVRSGYLAADAILNQSAIIPGKHPSFLVDDLPSQWPARWLSHSAASVTARLV